MHKTKFIEYKDLSADVDENIADLILNLWKLDIVTLNSCENNVPQDWVWIEFLSAIDAESFLNIVANEYSDDYNSLYNRIKNAWDGNTEENVWKISVNIDDLNVVYDEIGNDEVIETSIGKPTMNLIVSVRFPISDLLEVKKLIKNKINVN